LDLPEELVVNVTCVTHFTGDAILFVQQSRGFLRPAREQFRISELRPPALDFLGVDEALA
jgi:hypothetical protein